MGLGANREDPAETFNEALSRMEAYGDEIRFAKASDVYVTEPQGEVKDQPWFHNQVVRYDVDPEIWSPEGFLSTLQAIEAQVGRDRGAETPGGPRVLDMDLLLFGDVEQATGYLDLPHPRMLERAFVLVPLRQIAPDLVLPGGKTPAQALADLDYHLEGNRIRQS